MIFCVALHPSFRCYAERSSSCSRVISAFLFLLKASRNCFITKGSTSAFTYIYLNDANLISDQMPQRRLITPMF